MFFTCVYVFMCIHIPSSVSSGWMSVPVGSMGALMAFFPSSWRSLTSKTIIDTKTDSIKQTSRKILD